MRQSYFTKKHTIMNKTTIKNNRLTLFSFCIIFLFSSCVNELDSETSPDAVPGTIPINFTTKVSKADTRVTNTAFEKGDKVDRKSVV